MRSRQLKFVFAVSPQGGGKSGPSDASAGRDFLLHIANSRTANDLGARAADASQSHWPLDGHDRPSPETGTQRAGCVTHKSGSERGLGAKAPGPTRRQGRSLGRSARVIDTGSIRGGRSPATCLTLGMNHESVRGGYCSICFSCSAGLQPTGTVHACDGNQRAH